MKIDIELTNFEEYFFILLKIFSVNFCIAMLILFAFVLTEYNIEQNKEADVEFGGVHRYHVPYGREDDGFFFEESSEDLPEIMFSNTDEYHIQIGTEYCTQIPCYCYNENPMCAMICYECEVEDGK